MSRGVAKRPIFECADDLRYFLSLLAREVRRGVLEVHAFVLMQTHFHLLVRSPLGRMSKAMERVLGGYSRWFNRRRGRDGGLFKERYKSELVDSELYRSWLVRYIDDNPLKPGLARHAAAYPYGSAFLYAKEAGPRWLERVWIEEEVRSVRGALLYAPADYGLRFPSRLPGAIAELIEDRLLRRQPREEEFGDLLAPHAASQIAWLVRKTLLADGMEPFVLPLPPGLVREEWERLQVEEPLWPLGIARKSGILWLALLAGLWRHSCGLSYPEIRARSGVPDSTTAGRARRHRVFLQDDAEYARRVALVIERVQRRLNREAYPHRFAAVDRTRAD